MNPNYCSLSTSSLRLTNSNLLSPKATIRLFGRRQLMFLMYFFPLPSALGFYSPSSNSVAFAASAKGAFNSPLPFHPCKQTTFANLWRSLST